MPYYDAITLGETMLRFTPPGMQRIAQANSFEIYPAGSESNTAVGLARLGLKSAWLSRLTDNPLGRALAAEVARHGVDTSHIVWTKEDRVGLNFTEEGGMPRGSRVIYDRRGSAMSNMQTRELPADLFKTADGQLFHTSGITLAISEHAAATATRAVQLARSVGWLVTFDFNYRSQLWTPELARAGCDGIMRQADIIFIPRRDATLVYGDDDAKALLKMMAGRYPQATLVMTLGEKGAVAVTPDGKAFSQNAFVADELDRIGGGDAFSAGFIYGYLTSKWDVATALRYGAAVAALKYSIRGDLPLVDLGEVDELIKLDGGRGSAKAKKAIER